jgi:hypothetical protein
MNGQWIADYNGSNTGRLVVDIDRVHDHYEEAYSVDSGSSICSGWEPLGGPALFLGLSRLMMSQ